MPGLNISGYVDPYAPTKQGLEQFYPEVFDMYQQGPAAPLTPEQQVAGLDPLQQQAVQGYGAYGQPGGAGAGLQDFAAGQLGAGLNMDEVSRYADNPYLDDEITAALRDPFRQLTEQTLPGIDLAGAGLGGGSNSRLDIASGVAERGYADRASDVGAQMRSDAYGKGLQTATATRGQDLDYTNLAGDLGLTNIGAGMYGGDVLQGQEQLLRNANMENFDYNQNAPWQMAENYAALTTPGAESFGETYGRPDTDVSDLFAQMIGQSGTEFLGGQLDDILKNLPWV